MKEIKGFNFSAINADVKKIGAERLDFGLILADSPCVCAGVTTQNQVVAAPVIITRDHLKNGKCRAILVNSGNANAYTGDDGIEDAHKLIQSTADHLGLPPEEIIPMSTGVIGLRLPIDRMLPRIPDLVSGLAPDRFMDVAHAIMTTDTRVKTTYWEDRIPTGEIQLAGMTKGAGMIAPNMATMLAIIATNAAPRPEFLSKLLLQIAERTFNAITVDGDTSTNDTLVILAGPESSRVEISSSKDEQAFADLLEFACRDLAKQIVLDGEGATKLVYVKVMNAGSDSDAAGIARKISESPLVKTAFHGEDPNWGRIVCAAGNSGVQIDPARLTLWIGDTLIVKSGKIVESDWETQAHQTMKEAEFTVTLDVGLGTGQATFMTTDFSEEYIKINADYRS